MFYYPKHAAWRLLTSPRGLGVFFILFAQVLYVISGYMHLPLLTSCSTRRLSAARRPSLSLKVRTLPSAYYYSNKGAD